MKYLYCILFLLFANISSSQNFGKLDVNHLKKIYNTPKAEINSLMESYGYKFIQLDPKGELIFAYNYKPELDAADQWLTHSGGIVMYSTTESNLKYIEKQLSFCRLNKEELLENGTVHKELMCGTYLVLIDKNAKELTFNIGVFDKSRLD